MRNRNFKLFLIDSYIVNQLVPTLVFFLLICTVICEMVGISFEQLKFVALEGLSADITAQVHFFKLPTFICQALPLAILITTIKIYSNLSARNEIIALQSFGISPYRLIFITIEISFALTVSMFLLQELVVPPANYQAAMVLEREWQVDRTQLAKYNKREIVYPKYSVEGEKPSLEFLFVADRFDGRQMQGITLIKYNNRYLQQIITAQTARWNERKQLWWLFNGHQYVLNTDGSYALTKDFEQLSIYIEKDILDYADHHRDLREMNLLELYHRLNLIKDTNNNKNIRQLKISIQERYALPCSCIIFAFLGSTLGIITGTANKSNGLGLAAIVVLVYYFVKFLTTALTIAQAIPILVGVWLPNLLCLSLGCYVHFYFSERQSV